MSGVYIKGMRMPTSCYDCLFTVRKNGTYCYCPFCHAEYSNPSNEPDGRLANCPLVPVPDHGRLKDVDELIALHRARAKKAGGVSGLISYMAAEVLDVAQTIIPADKEEDNG